MGDKVAAAGDVPAWVLTGVASPSGKRPPGEIYCSWRVESGSPASALSMEARVAEGARNRPHENYTNTPKTTSSATDKFNRTGTSR